MSECTACGALLVIAETIRYPEHGPAHGEWVEMPDGREAWIPDEERSVTMRCTNPRCRGYVPA